MFLNLEEAEALVKASRMDSIRPYRDHAMIRLFLQTGLRVSELLRLRVEDVDFKERCLFIQGKGDQERLVPFTENTALEAYLAVRRPASNPAKELFLNPRVKPVHKARVPSRLPVYLALEEAEKLLEAAAAGPSRSILWDEHEFTVLTGFSLP